MKDELMWLLGYITEEQWKSAYSEPMNDKDELDKIKKEVEEEYEMEIDIQ